MSTPPDDRPPFPMAEMGKWLLSLNLQEDEEDDADLRHTLTTLAHLLAERGEHDAAATLEFVALTDEDKMEMRRVFVSDDSRLN